jgi:hypothetical protein
MFLYDLDKPLPQLWTWRICLLGKGRDSKADCQTASAIDKRIFIASSWEFRILSPNDLLRDFLTSRVTILVAGAGGTPSKGLWAAAQ